MIGTNMMLSPFFADPKVWMVGLYLRLSKDDDNQGESASISNQRDLLTSFCNSKGWTIVKVYQDDGFTGLNMDRPGLQELLADVRAKKINFVITKDLSRLGRNYLEVGNLIETFFPRNRTRYMALNDGIDTALEGNEILPFKTVLNEMYSKDISKKVHASYMVAAQKGLFTGTVPPFGYLKDPNQKGHLIVDPETAPYIKEIFQLALLGRGAGFIARWLERNQVPCPAWWNRQRGYRNVMTKWERIDPENGRFVWDETGIKDILRNPIYRGAIASQKRYHVFKSGDIGDRLPDEWIVVEDRHEPLVSKEDFALIQEKIKSRTRPRNNGQFSLFSGLIKCGKCGKALLYRRSNSLDQTPIYTCKTFMRYGKHHCSQHRIEEEDLKSRILQVIRHAANLVTIHPDEVSEKIEQARRAMSANQKDSLYAMIAKDEDRLKVLTRMMGKLYEDRMAELITEENFDQLRRNTQTEQKELEERIRLTKKQIEGDAEQETENQQWLDMISQYTDIQDFDAETLNRLVKRIIVHEEMDENDVRHIRVEIFFNFQPVPFVQEEVPDEQRPYSQKKDLKRVLNVETGEVFDSIAAASTSINRDSRTSHIRDCCEGRRRSSYGYHWQYAD